MLSEDKRIQTKAQLKEWLDEENKRYPMSGRRYLSYLLQISEGAILRKHTKLLRTAEYHTNAGHKLRSFIWRTRLMRFQMKRSLHIPMNCFEKGLYISHCLPVGGNGNIVVGKNCRIMPGVYLTGDDKEDKAPVIGDDVTLGIDCIVKGDVYLADGITVGAGAVVTHSFYEKGISIAGVPAKKVGGSKIQ